MKSEGKEKQMSLKHSKIFLTLLLFKKSMIQSLKTHSSCSWKNVALKLYFLIKAIKITNVITIKPVIPFGIYTVVITSTHIYKVSRTK